MRKLSKSGKRGELSSDKLLTVLLIIVTLALAFYFLFVRSEIKSLINIFPDYTPGGNNEIVVEEGSQVDSNCVNIGAVQVDKSNSKEYLVAVKQNLQSDSYNYLGLKYDESTETIIYPVKYYSKHKGFSDITVGKIEDSINKDGEKEKRFIADKNMFDANSFIQSQIAFQHVLSGVINPEVKQQGLAYQLWTLNNAKVSLKAVSSDNVLFFLCKSKDEIKPLEYVPSKVDENARVLSLKEINPKSIPSKGTIWNLWNLFSPGNLLGYEIVLPYDVHSRGVRELSQEDLNWVRNYKMYKIENYLFVGYTDIPDYMAEQFARKGIGFDFNAATVSNYFPFTKSFVPVAFIFPDGSVWFYKSYYDVFIDEYKVIINENFFLKGGYAPHKTFSGDIDYHFGLEPEPGEKYGFPRDFVKSNLRISPEDFKLLHDGIGK